MAFALATYNVENLFDARSEDERPALEDKLNAIAETVRDCNADVVGLQEVGSVVALRALLGKLSAQGYRDPVVGTPDARGIRCALVTRLPLSYARIATADSLAFPVFHEGDPLPFATRIPLRRGIVDAGVLAPGIGEVHVLVAHFKSRLGVPLRDANGLEVVAATPRARSQGLARSLVWRAAEALYVRGLADEALAADASAHVVVTGDLNDGPESAVLQVLRGEGEGALFDCTSTIEPSRRFSTFHEGRPAQIDHVLATAGLAGRVTGAQFLNAGLRDAGLRNEPAPQPRPPMGEDEPIAIDSDHAALVVRFG